ncbi:hypothetical protein BGZ81_005046 [Podila clonocystis]|nr:hypothetical protein BGZ81_005046 [Podila clonocystis]
MVILLVVYMLVLLLQIFSIGVVPKNKKLMMWISAFHLGAIVCFFWILICKILILFQFIEDGTKHTVNKSAAMLIHIPFVFDPEVYAVLAIAVFGSSQALLFVASPIIERVSYRRINASMFSALLDLVAVSCVYKFWNSIIDDTWGDMVL